MRQKENVTFEQFKKECELKKLKLLEGSYKGPHYKHLCLDENGYKVMVVRNQTIRCNRKTSPFHEANPYTLENIEQFLKENNSQFELVKGQTYIKAAEHLKFKCNVCGEEIKMSWANMISGKGCGSCNGTQVTNFNSIEKKASHIIKYLKSKNDAKEYTYKSHKKIKTVCPKCKAEDEKIIKNLTTQGFWCSECSPKSVGNFNLKNRNKFKKEFQKKDCLIYFIECWDKEEKFYKIGITTRSVKERFRKEKDMPYNYKILKIEKTNLYEAIYKEFKLHQLLRNKNLNYKPNKRFDGETECFLSIQEVL